MAHDKLYISFWKIIQSKINNQATFKTLSIILKPKPHNKILGKKRENDSVKEGQT